jgi:hypothetical protein
VNFVRPIGTTADANLNPPPTGPALVITADSMVWRYRLGPLAWTALQHLALRSLRTAQGWAAPVGVRDIAAGIHVTKDTAAGAVSRLLAAGLVTRGRHETADGRQRAGYLLNLPASMWLIDCPKDLDIIEDRQADCPKGEYSTPTTEKVDCLPPPDSQPSRTRRASAARVEAPRLAPLPRPSWDQPALFDPPRVHDISAPSPVTGETA